MLSILIPTYNYNVLPLVEELHRQVLEEGIPFEIIVLDDYSTHSKIVLENEKMSTLGHITFTRNAANLGRTITRKSLAEKAKYETLLFLDSDVMPTSSDFIRTYIPFIGKAPVVIGGIAYKTPIQQGTELRYKYGKEREEKTALQRNKNPYGAVLSGNILIDRQVFLKNNYPGKDNLYGMDIYFSNKLYSNNVPIKHIDNPVYHIGLENNVTFFEKSLKAVDSRHKMLSTAPGIENVNALLKYYKKLERYRLTSVVKVLFVVGRPLLKKMILKKDPNLFCLDIYRLGYICSLK